MSFMANLPRERRCEIVGVFMLGVTAFLFVALATDGYQGSASRPMGDAVTEAANALGPVGAAVASFLTILLGRAAHVLYFLTAIWGLMLFNHRPLDRLLTRLVGMLILCGAVAGMVHIDFGRGGEKLPGGALGAFTGDRLLEWFGVIPSNVVGVTLAVIGILLATEFLFVRMVTRSHSLGMLIIGTMVVLVRALTTTWKARRERLAQTDDSQDDETFENAPRKPSRGRKQKDKVIERLPRWSYRGPVDDAVDEEPVPVPAPVRPRRLPRERAVTVESEPVHTSGRLTEARGLPSPTSEPRIMGAGNREREVESRTLGGTVGDFFERPDDEPAATVADIPYFELIEEGAPIDEPVVDESEKPAALASMSDEDEADLAVSEESPSRQTEFTASVNVSAATPSVDPKTRRSIQLRRKALLDEELPEDYVYPKKYKRPPLDLFDLPPATALPEELGEQLRRTSLLLEETLMTFGIEARVTDVTRGPTITRYELEPAPGIKVSRFLALADDIALALKAYRVRVEAPIPGKGRVGIEVPNTDREPVVVRELLESKAYKRAKGALPLALGKGIAGDVVTADLATMPHLLVAGATGAGKTVCVKTLLASLLVTNTPEELQLMLIDPKMVELSIFNDIPHLITPVVTDPKKAASALQWLINEMGERYRLFADLRVRNIEIYNESVENGEIEMAVPDGEEAPPESLNAIRKLPYIVCMIDELADLMMLARAEVEDAIARLAQLARAVGIHLIIATQRPSVDVLTGVIKANFPARISFQVSSRVDSRCILDEIGAERLIGRGDMLYLPAGQSKPTRIQGAFVSDEEMNALVAYLKTQAPPQYRDEIERFGKSKESITEIGEEDDDLFDDAVKVVLETGQASISMVQRRLRVGYTRAARLIDMMELRGIVGPHIGSKAREILVNLPDSDDEVA